MVNCRCAGPDIVPGATFDQRFIIPIPAYQAVGGEIIYQQKDEDLLSVPDGDDPAEHPNHIARHPDAVLPVGVEGVIKIPDGIEVGGGRVCGFLREEEGVADDRSDHKRLLSGRDQIIFCEKTRERTFSDPPPFHIPGLIRPVLRSS